MSSPTGVLPVYDAAGDITTGTSSNQYLYDAEGRICAVEKAGIKTGYVYDASGNRVAKGPITQWSCDPTKNGFESSGKESDYIVNQSGQPVTKTTMGSSGTMQWNYTNVYADGMLFATYDAQGLHFQLNDWLGTRRMTTDYAGVLEQTCASLPYGDQLNCSGSPDAPNEQHFTGKTHDDESGLDYFGARYYSENDGRFMSPDWSAKVEPVPYAKMDDPQSLNLYGYMLDSPLDGVDQDGHCDWCQRVVNWWNNNGFQTNAQLAAAQAAQNATVTETETYSVPGASNADTGGDYGTSTMTFDPTAGMTVTAGGSVGPVGASFSYTPGTGQVNQTTSVGPMGVGASASVSSSAPSTGTSATVSGYYGVGGSASVTSTGQISTSVGLGTPGVGASVNSTMRLGSIAPLSINITMPNIAPDDAACGGGICMEDDFVNDWQP